MFSLCKVLHENVAYYVYGPTDNKQISQTQCGLTQAGVVGEHALQSQTLLPLVATAFTVTPQRHVCRAVTDVVGCHDGTCRSEGLESVNVSFGQGKG